MLKKSSQFVLLISSKEYPCIINFVNHYDITAKHRVSRFFKLKMLSS